VVCLYDIQLTRYCIVPTTNMMLMINNDIHQYINRSQQSIINKEIENGNMGKAEIIKPHSDSTETSLENQIDLDRSEAHHIS
jgi:hypothetical protein